MIRDYKKILKHSLIYGFGMALSRAVGFFMIPVYTRYLTPADYGIFELLNLTRKILTMFLTLGLSSATLRYYFEYSDKKTKDKVISTALIASTVIAFCGALAANLFRSELSLLCFDSSQYAGFFTIALMAMAFEIASEVPLSYIRANEFSVLFSIVMVGQLIVGLSLNILFIVYYGMGVKGILLSGLITSGIFGILLIGYTFAKTIIAFSKSLFKKLVAYGWPLIFSGFGFFIINSSDRIFIKHFANLGELGLYSLGAKFASVLTLIILGPFWKMYGPYRFSIMHRDDAKPVYAGVQKSMFLFMLTCGLGLIVLSKDVLIIMATPPFYAASKAIPFLVLSIVCLTMYYLFQTGIYLKKKTILISKLVGATAVISLISNFILVPRMGMEGAAQARFISYLALALMTLVVSQRVYRIRYDVQTNIIFAAGALITWFISSHVVFENIWMRIGTNTILVVIYFVIMIRVLFGNFSNIKALISREQLDPVS